LNELNAKNAARIKRLACALPFYKHLGITLTEVNWGNAELQLNVTRKLIQSAGFAHGGVTAALIDSAVGLALCTMVGPRDRITTIELHVNFIAPAKLGLLKTKGQILHRGRRTAVGDAEVRDEDGMLISKGSATYMIIKNGRKRTVNFS
jgi:uncharacterized protein (TIGR00369 family)